jgi:hypothetical protein
LRKLAARTLVLLAALLLGPLPARADEWFSKTRLQVPGNPKTVLVCDLDGNGLQDLAAAYAVSHATRLRYYVHLAAFLQGPSGFSRKPDVTVPLARGESVVFLGETDPSRPGPELLTLHDRGVSAWRVDRGGGAPRWVKEELGGIANRWIGADWRIWRGIWTGTDATRFSSPSAEPSRSWRRTRTAATRCGTGSRPISSGKPASPKIPAT